MPALTSAREHLEEAYQTWRQLTEDEREAIQANNWTRVGECQSAKQHLQPEIIRLTDLAHAECRDRHVSRAGLDYQIRKTVSELIVLETQNASTLGELMASTKREKDELDESNRNLQRVRKSYASPTGSYWQSYS